MPWTFDPPPPPVVRVMETSGENRATITCTPWGARGRLRYTDATAIRGFATDPETGREVPRMATIRLIATSITVTAAEGFPPVTVDGVEEEFDPQREDHLLALPEDVYLEVVRHAMSVQPLPGSRVATPPPAEDEDGDAGEDPTRTPSTHPVPSSGPDGGRRRTPTSTPTS